MSCPTCSCTASGSTCDSCGTFISIENGPVQPVNSATAVRVSDRNGMPRDLKAIPSGIPSADRYGDLRMRDGSPENLINLALLQQLMAVTKGIVVLDGSGNMALLPRPLVDSFLVNAGGVITWRDVLPKTNLFNASDITPYRGKLLTLGCSGNGMIEIGFLDAAEAEYIGIDSNGNPIGRNFCDADAVDNLDSLFGCKDGVFTKLNGAAGKKIVLNGDGQYELVDANEVASTLITPVIVCKKKVGYALATDLPIYDTQVDVPFGGLYTGTYDMNAIGTYVPGSTSAILRCVTGCNIKGNGTESHAQVIINGLVIVEGWMDTVDTFGFQNTVIFECPLDEDKFDFELKATVDGTGDSKSYSGLEVIGFK